MPSQVLEESDGRILISFENTAPGQAALVLRARPVQPAPAGPPAGSVTRPAAAPAPLPAPVSAPAPAAVEPPMNRVRVGERAIQDREIVYFLNDPATHSFSLYHDFTETRPGSDRYLNIVRRGSTVSNPSARLLDTGQMLDTQTLKGDAITKAGIDIGEPVQPDSEVVVVRFAAVKQGESLRIRIEETYTDPARYAVIDDQLMWRRSFGRPRNVMVLPAGWYLTTSSIPATVSETDDGRIRVSYVNPRPDSLDVFLKARRRSPSGASRQ